MIKKNRDALPVETVEVLAKSKCRLVRLKEETPPAPYFRLRCLALLQVHEIFTNVLHVKFPEHSMSTEQNGNHAHSLSCYRGPLRHRHCPMPTPKPLRQRRGRMDLM